MALETTNENPVRRTSGVQQRGRAARVVSSVLQATAEELTRVGYGGLRIDEVAARAGVNKTTIYRRWAGKAELVAETIRTFLSEIPDPDTGSLRSDLLAHFGSLLKNMKEPQWRGIMMTLNSHVDPRIDSLAKELRKVSRKHRADLVQRGVDRGELPRQIDVDLVAELVSTPVLYRVLHVGEPVDEAYIESVLDVVLAGAAANALRSRQGDD